MPEPIGQFQEIGASSLTAGRGDCFSWVEGEFARGKIKLRALKKIFRLPDDSATAASDDDPLGHAALALWHRAATAQRAAQGSPGGAHLVAEILEARLDAEEAWVILPQAQNNLRYFLQGGVPLAPQIHNLLGSLLHGLQAIHAIGRRPHGNLRITNVLVYPSKRGPLFKLTDLAPVDPAQLSAREDLRQLGNLLLELIVDVPGPTDDESENKHLHDDQLEAWKNVLGPAAPAVFQLANDLLFARELSLEALCAKYPPPPPPPAEKPKWLVPALAAAGCAALAAIFMAMRKDAPATAGPPMVNSPPIAGPAPSFDVEVNRIHSANFTGSDPEGAPLSYRLHAEGTRGNVTVQNAKFTYSAPATPGADQFKFEAFDGTNSSALITVDITVKDAPASPPPTNTIAPLNQPPRINVIAPITAFPNEDKVIDFSGADPDGDALTFQWDPETAITRSGTTYTLRTANKPGENFVDYWVTDGKLSSRKERLKIIVTDRKAEPPKTLPPVVPPPSVANATFTAAYLEPLPIQFPAANSPNPALLKIDPNVAALKHGKLINQDGHWIYEVTNRAVYPTGGEELFDYTAVAGTNRSNRASVAIKIPANDIIAPPFTNHLEFRQPFRTNISAVIHYSASQRELAPEWSISVYPASANKGEIKSALGVILYTWPTEPPFARTVYLAYSANDGLLNKASSITLELNRPPLAITNPQPITNAVTLAIGSLANDPAGEELTFREPAATPLGKWILSADKTQLAFQPAADAGTTNMVSAPIHSADGRVANATLQLAFARASVPTIPALNIVNTLGMTLIPVRDFPGAEGVTNYIGQTEVTAGQFRKLFPDNPDVQSVKDDYPAPVSFVAAVHFCKKLSEAEPRPGFEYTLLGYDQFLHLVKGLTPKTNDHVLNAPAPRPVLASKPTDRGFYELFGNLAEMCVQTIGDNAIPVRAGGHFKMKATMSMATNAFLFEAGSLGQSAPLYGFRVALVPSGSRNIQKARKIAAANE